MMGKILDHLAEERPSSIEVIYGGRDGKLVVDCTVWNLDPARGPVPMPYAKFSLHPDDVASVAHSLRHMARTIAHMKEYEAAQEGGAS